MATSTFPAARSARLQKVGNLIGAAMGLPVVSPSLLGAMTVGQSLGGDFVLLGHHDDAIRRKPPSMAWLPTTEDFEAPKAQQSRASHTVKVRVARFEARLVGGTYAETEDLLHALGAQLHTLLGGNAYELERAQWREGDVGVECLVECGIRIPMLANELAAVTAETASFGVVMTNALGTSAEQGVG